MCVKICAGGSLRDHQQDSYYRAEEGVFLGNEPGFLKSVCSFPTSRAWEKKREHEYFFLCQSRSVTQMTKVALPWLLRPDSSAVRATCFTSAGNRALI
jgi:hypothetical protein